MRFRLSGFHTFYNSQKRGKNQKVRLRVHEIPILKVIFVTLTENLSVVANGTQLPQEFLYHWKETLPCI